MSKLVKYRKQLSKKLVIQAHFKTEVNNKISNFLQKWGC